MPLQRRLPKRGFVSLTRRFVEEVRLSDLSRVDGDVADMLTLKRLGLVSHDALAAKVILAGKLDRAVTVQGLRVTKGARAAIEAAGGKIAE